MDETALALGEELEVDLPDDEIRTAQRWAARHGIRSDGTGRLRLVSPDMVPEPAPELKLGIEKPQRFSRRLQTEAWITISSATSKDKPIIKRAPASIAISPAVPAWRIRLGYMLLRLGVRVFNRGVSLISGARI